MTALRMVKHLTRWARSDKAQASRIRRAEDRDLPQWPRKESAKCCVSKIDDLGRLPIGYCSPVCERRP